jgi:hypothetical protein
MSHILSTEMQDGHPEEKSGMTRDHPFANTPSGQHPLPRGGLVVVAHAHNINSSTISSPPVCIDISV